MREPATSDLATSYAGQEKPRLALAVLAIDVPLQTLTARLIYA